MIGVVDFDLIGRVVVTFCMIYTILDIAFKVSKKK